MTFSLNGDITIAEWNILTKTITVFPWLLLKYMKNNFTDVTVITLVQYIARKWEFRGKVVIYDLWPHGVGWKSIRLRSLATIRRTCGEYVVLPPTNGGQFWTSGLDSVDSVLRSTIVPQIFSWGLQLPDMTREIHFYDHFDVESLSQESLLCTNLPYLTSRWSRLNINCREWVITESSRRSLRPDNSLFNRYFLLSQLRTGSHYVLCEFNMNYSFYVPSRVPTRISKGFILHTLNFKVICIIFMVWFRFCCQFFLSNILGTTFMLIHFWYSNLLVPSQEAILIFLIACVRQADVCSKFFISSQNIRRYLTGAFSYSHPFR